jgi:hypothetical protein
MSVASQGSGTQTCVIGTEHFVQDVDSAGVYTLHIDTNALGAGDVLEVRVYQMIITAGTPRIEQLAVYAGVQDIPIKVSEPLSNELTDSQSLRFSLKQTFGTGRAIPWKVLKHA